MNIEKLVKHLKEFTLDEIEMIAEVDCKMAIKQLLNEHKIVFKNEKYYFIEQEISNYGVFTPQNRKEDNLEFKNAVNDFIEKYVKKSCKKTTLKYYNSTFKFYIIPFFKNKDLADIGIEDIKMFYKKCLNLKLKPRRIKNTLALLNQLIKYYQNSGMIERKCVFQVKRLTEKNKFSINRIIFEGEK